jgi:hypothetical protein
MSTLIYGFGRPATGSETKLQISRGICGSATSTMRSTLANRGLSPEELAAVRPGLVYVSLCAFSHKGPWASRRGFDTVVQTVSGITTRHGELFPGAEPGPQFYPVSAIDYLTGYLMAFGAMVALVRRARRRQLARAHFTGADRPLAGRPRRGAREHT